MSFRNRTGLCGLLIGSSLAMASACGGLSDVKIVINDNGGSGNPSGGDGSSAKGGANPNGGQNPGESGAGGMIEGPGAGAGGVAGDQGVAGVGNEGGEGGVFIPPDPMPGPPTVASVSPADGATNGDALGVVRITFSEPLDPNTATSANIQIKDSAGTVLDGSVTYSDAVATFRPTRRLNLLASYSVNVSAAVKDAGGTAMTRPFMSSFTVRDGVWGKSEGPLTSATSGLPSSVGSIPIPIPIVASDGGSHAVAVWTQQTDANTYYDVYAALYNQGKGWAAPVKVNTNTVTCTLPSVSMNASGNLIIGWIENDSAAAPQTYSIQTRRNIGGNWDTVSTRVDVAASTAYTLIHQRVAVALTTTGHAHVAWYSYDTNTTTTPSVVEYGVFARHADAGGAWDGVTSLTYLQAASSASVPGLSFDAAGNGFATYQFAPTATPLKVNTVVMRFLTTTNKWGTSALTSTQSDNTALPVAVAASPTGEAVLGYVRQTVDPNTSTTTYDMMGSYFNKAWSAPAVISSTTTIISTTPWAGSATWTGSSFLVAWPQSGGSGNNIYASQYKTSWMAPAIISDGNHPAAYPWVVGDGRGNALAVWAQTSDTPPSGSTTFFDIVSARFVGATDKWSNALRVSTGVGSYRTSQAAILGDGSAVATWERVVVNGKLTTPNALLSNDFQ